MARTVQGIGRRDARLYLLGESPGEEEERRDEPFVGPSGRLLNESLRWIGLDRAAARIDNVCPIRPPRFEDDTEAAARWWRDAHAAYRTRLADVCGRASRVETVVLIGGRALEAFLGGWAKVLHLRGSIWRQSDLRDVLPPDLRFPGNPKIVPTIHPAWIMRGSWAWRKVLAKDLWRAVRAPAVRPIPLPPVGDWTELETGPPGETVLDLETSIANPFGITLAGALRAGRFYQLSDAWSRLGPALETSTMLVGHNLADFDLGVLDENGIAHHGPYWDTISQLALVDPDLPRRLDGGCSRHLLDWLQWKGVMDDPNLQSILGRAYGASPELRSDPAFWPRFYNELDVINTGALKEALWTEMSEPLRALWQAAYIPNVGRRRAMTARGMRPDLDRFRVEADAAWDELAQAVAEVQAVAEPYVEQRAAVAGQAVDSTIPPKCADHLVKDANPTCPVCIARRARMAARIRAQTVVKRAAEPFNPDSAADWRWLIFEALGYRYRTIRPKNGEPFRTERRGLMRTEGGALSVDDDAIRLLRRKLRAEGGPDDPLLDLRVRIAHLAKAIGTYYEPVLSGKIVWPDGRCRPPYHDWRTATGRYSSGTSEDGATK